MTSESCRPLSIDDRKMRWCQFMDPAGTVRRMRLVQYDEGRPVRPPLWPDKRVERVDWMVRDCHWQAEQAAWLDDDKVPHIDCLTGTEIFAEAFGCHIHRPEDNMPFALPCVHNAAEAARLKVPELSASTLALLFELADEALARVGAPVPLRLPDIQSPMDIAALIWEKSDFYIAMIEEPEAVRELAEKVRTLLTAFLDAWFRRYGTGYVAHFPPYWMEGGVTLSEDEVGAVNPAMFDTFFLPELEALSIRYSGLGMHCCANAEHQWEGFRRIPGLRLLNLIQPKAAIRRAIPFFAADTAQWHNYLGEASDLCDTDAYPPETRAVLEVPAATADEARRAAERLRTEAGMA